MAQLRSKVRSVQGQLQPKLTDNPSSEILDLMAKKKTNKLSPRNKWLAIFGIFVILIITFLAIKPTYVKAPTQTSSEISIDTSNWKTYENYMYSYTLDYPKNWLVKEQCYKRDTMSECSSSAVIFESYPFEGFEKTITDKEGYILNSIKLDVPEDANGLIVSIRIISAQNGLSVKDFASSTYNSKESGTSYPVSEETIGSNIFVKADISDKGPHSPIYFIEDPNGNILEISGTITAKNFEYEKMPKSEYKYYLDTFNKIISTFKFTN